MCCRAEHLSFAELFKDLAKYVDDPHRRFKLCVRAKRGLEETDRGGGFYKDKAYFEGAMKVLLKRREFDIELLYSGKISVSDLLKPEVQALIVKENMKVPHFIEDKEEYKRVLDTIARTNFLN